MNIIAKKLMGGGKILSYLLGVMIAFASSIAWAEDRTISEDYILPANEIVDGVLTVASGATVDLNGHRLTVQGLAGGGTITGDPDFVISDLTSPDTSEPYHVTWVTKFSTGNDVEQGDLRDGATTPRNLFNDSALEAETNNNSKRILVKSENLPLAVTYDFGAGEQRKVTKYRLYMTRNHTGNKYYNRGPKDWKFEGSDDKEKWDPLDSKSGITWSAYNANSNPYKEYEITNETSYRYYRIVFMSSSDTSFLELNRLEYFDTSVQPELHISVPDGASAQNSTVTISGCVKVVKEGKGEFSEEKVGQSYTGGTVLSEGTYAIAGEASLDWSKFTFGTDPAKPVTLVFNTAATLSPVPDPWYVGNIANINSTVYKTGGDWSLGELTVGGRASGVVTKFYHTSGSMSLTNWLVVCNGTSDSSHGDSGYFEISGGSVINNTQNANRAFIGNYGKGKMVVKSGGEYVSKYSLVIGKYASSQGVLEIGDGGMVTVEREIIFNESSTDSTGIINLNSGGVLCTKSVWRKQAGTAKFNFNGGKFKAFSGGVNIFAENGANGTVDVIVSENGGIIDNDSKAITISRTITGDGGLTFTGTGATRIIADQAYTGTTTVSEGTTLSVSNVTFAGSVSFAAGSKLNLASYTSGVTPLSAGALTLPEDGTVELTLNGGAFKKGVYIICSASGVSKAYGEKFAFTTTDNLSSEWSVDDNRLLLTVGSDFGNFWTGLTGDGKMSSNGNWADGTAPVNGEAVDFSGITVSTTIDADIANVTFGTVTMGSGPVVFTNDYMRATSFSDTSKVAVTPNSTVTLDGNLEFGTNVESYVCRYIFEGGKFVVTGNIIATTSQTGDLFPHLANNTPGSICANGLVNNASSDVFCLVQKNYDRGANWQIGEGGISGSKRFILGHSGGGNVTITATADFTVSADIVQYSKLTLIPDGHKITLGTNVTIHAGGILGGGANGLTTVSGPGKVVVNYDVTKLTSYTGSQPNAFKVASGGTLAIVSGANTSVSTDNKGMITVESGATLEVAESGTVKLGCNHKFEDQAILKFNFTRRKEAPILNLADKTVEFGNNKSIKVSLSGVRPVSNFGGRWVLTTGGKFADIAVELVENSPDWVLGVGVENGEIYVNIKPEGTRIVVR